MSKKRYSLEFRNEAVRQVVEFGHRVDEVASRLNIPADYLQSWVQERRNASNGQLSPFPQDLQMVMQENLSLRKQLEDSERERQALMELIRKGL